MFNRRQEQQSLRQKFTSKEFNGAEIFPLPSEQELLSSKEEFNHLFNSLNVFIDKDGLIKIKGRLQNALLNPPILLNKGITLSI